VKKCAFLVASLVAALLLALTSCGSTSTSTSTRPAAPSTTVTASVPPVTATATQSQTQTVRNSAGKQQEKPKYGGTFVRVASASPNDWDEITGSPPVWSIVPITDPILIGDWTKGPEGSGQLGFNYFVSPSPATMVGCVAEDWRIVDDKTLQLSIRSGIHFHDKPPTNGRELTADDVAYSLNRIASAPRSFAGRNAPLGRSVESITAPDKRTLVIKVAPGQLFLVYYTYLCQGGLVIPREVIQQNGSMADWKVGCGTGPFLITDFVTDSSVTYIKNQNYWAKDPLLPDYTLPYIDKLKVLIIADRSTQLAAFRTGKIDQMENLTMEEKQEFARSNPAAKWSKLLPITSSLNWRVDKKPFDDLRVRKALSIAVDRSAIAKSLYNGDAEIQVTGCYPIGETKDYYTPLEQLPDSAREVYDYSPERAKKLLAEAGFPNGFKTEVVCSTIASEVDLMSVIKDYWSAVGVNLEIVQKESAVLSNVITNRAYTIVASAPSPYRPESFTAFTKGQEVNRSMVDDPIVNQAAVESIATFLTDRPKNIELVKTTLVHIIGQAYMFVPPVPYYYVGWHPWVKGYFGELGVGGRGQQFNYPKYLWMDQDLKSAMGH
jgi:peptide/nickel transport system substrate-binding protein